jgi:hypothetical protein
MIREAIKLIEGKTIKVDFSSLVNTYSDGDSQENDDSYYFFNSLKQHKIDYERVGDDVIEIPANKWNLVKGWKVKKI